MKHPDRHPLAGKTVKIATWVADPAQKQVVPGAEYRIEDWWDRIAGVGWGEAPGNPACLHYSMRAAFNKIPVDDEVLYGKIGAFGHLVHVSEIEYQE